MSTCLPRLRTLLPSIMVFCLGFWGVHAWSHDTGTRYHKKHLKDARGQLIPAGAAPERDGGMIQLEDRDPDYRTEIKLMEEVEPIPPVSFKAVSVIYFRTMVDRAESYHDVLRVFLGENFSDEEIDRIMTRQRYIDSKLTDGVYFNDITLEGMQKSSQSQQTALVQYNDIIASAKLRHSHDSDVMLSDRPHCEDCFSIQSSDTFRDSLRDTRRLGELPTRQRRHRPYKRSKKKNNKNGVPKKKCSRKRRKDLSQRIGKCKVSGNRKLCRKLRDRYKKLRRQCKKTVDNEAVPPTIAPVTLPSLVQTSTSTPGTSSQPLEYPEDLEKWQATQRDTKLHGQCGRPVAELVRIRELTMQGDLEYQPQCVVRYRCRTDSGCCQYGYQCGAKTSVNITKSILVGQLDPQQQNVNNVNVQHFQLSNDTECECQKMRESTLRPCPYPFNYSLHECKCRSKELEHHCKKIRNGNARLDRTDIECILRGDCRPLDNSVCEHFITEEGRCLKHAKVKVTNDEG